MKWNEAFNLMPVIGDVGVEVELENINKAFPNNMLTGVWVMHKDGSLRNGVELVSNPLPMDSVVKTISKLFYNLEKNEGHTDFFSPRTSIHFHVNILDREVEEVKRIYFTSVMLDVVFAKLGGDNREGNLFCNRLIDAPDQLGTAFSFINIGRKINGAATLKYAAVNIAPALYQGSIEYRTLEGTIELDRIHNYLLLIDCIHTYACKKNSILEIFNEFVGIGNVGKVLNHIGFDEKAIIITKKLQEDFDRTKSLALDIAYTQ